MSCGAFKEIKEEKMKEIILIKNGELALKGLNRSSFESVLAKNIKRRLRGLGKFKVTCLQSRNIISGVKHTYLLTCQLVYPLTRISANGLHECVFALSDNN